MQPVCDFHIELLSIRNACNAIISPMSLTFSTEITSAKSSPSFQYIPFENFVTNISILTPLELICLFRALGKLAHYKASLRKSTRQSQSRCVTGAQNALQTAKEPSKEIFHTRRLKSFRGVFRNDFATVDVREELCYHSRYETANSRAITSTMPSIRHGAKRCLNS